MSTITAQILVGNAHPYHGGIMNPLSTIWLSENSRPALNMQRSRMIEGPRRLDEIIWIPTLENMLEDAFLMIGIHLIQDAQLIALATDFYSDACDKRIDALYEHFTNDQRLQLYGKTKSLVFPKLIISVFNGSHIRNQLSVIEQYGMDVEICLPIL